MRELETLIKIYHTAFLVFLILGILFLAVSILLFFYFDIRGIYDLRSGRGARRTIQKMQEINAQTGKLRSNEPAPTPVRLEGENRISAPPTEKTGPVPESGGGGESETAMLGHESAETTLLKEMDVPLVEGGTVPQPELPGAFEIEKKLMWVHTEVMI